VLFRSLQQASAVEVGEPEATQEVRRAWEDYLAALTALERAGNQDQSRDIYLRQLVPTLSRVQKFVDHIVTINQGALLKKSEQDAAKAAEFQAMVLGVSVGALVLGLLVSLAATMRLLKPLDTLSQAVQRIGGGDFEARVSVGGRDEVTRLAGEVNLMAHRLRQYRQNSLGELLLAQQASQAAIDSLPDPVLVFSPDGRLNNVNEAAESLVGEEPEDEAQDGWQALAPALRPHLRPLVEQVLDNLIDNAIKHSGAPGSVELNVLQQQGGVVFQVSDRGVGMQGQHKLQGDESRGMGIGLQLCHAVAQVHAGCLSFSTPAIARQGVLAIFTLPLAEAQEQGA